MGNPGQYFLLITSVSVVDEPFFRVVGLNGLPGQLGPKGPKGERGGAPPGFEGDVGLPGARGRPGGKE